MRQSASIVCLDYEPNEAWYVYSAVHNQTSTGDVHVHFVRSYVDQSPSARRCSKFVQINCVLVTYTLNKDTLSKVVMRMM